MENYKKNNKTVYKFSFTSFLTVTPNTNVFTVITIIRAIRVMSTCWQTILSSSTMNVI